MARRGAPANPRGLCTPALHPDLVRVPHPSDTASDERMMSGLMSGLSALRNRDAPYPYRPGICRRRKKGKERPKKAKKATSANTTG